MKKAFLFMMAAMAMLALGRANDSSASFERVREGMTPASVVSIVGMPQASTPNLRGKFTFSYRESTTRRIWVITFKHDRVDSIEVSDD